MIRVNLLPVRKSRRRSEGRLQLLLFVGVIVLELALLTAAYLWVNDRLSNHQEQVDTLQTKVEELEEETEHVDRARDRLKELDEQLGAIRELEQRRIGPVQMLDELQAMVSEPRDEEDRIRQMERGWTVDWNPHRVWIDSFQEDGDGGFTLDGHAGDGDDVAEFLARMNTAVYFRDVELDYIQRESGAASELVSFHLYGELDYTGFDEEEEEAS